MNWKLLQDKQRELDNSIMEPRGLTYETTAADRLLAAMVELGEAANEIRSFKFWSRKPRSNDDIILEEMVDILHFILSLLNVYNVEVKNEVRPYKTGGFTLQILSLYKSLIFMNGNELNWLAVLQYYMGLCEMLGFTGDQVEYAYARKNKINYQRQEEGY